MEKSFEDDPEFWTLVNSIDFPSIYDIAEYAKKRGVSSVPAFWETFDLIRRMWQENKSCEGMGWYS